MQQWNNDRNNDNNYDAKILQDSNVFDEDYIPQKITSRKEQARKITDTIKRIKKKLHTTNLYVWGDSGTGKTLVIRHILQREFSKNNSFAYVNCWDNSAKHKILECIAEQTGFFVHGSEPCSALLKRLQKAKKRIVVCLDECDKIADKEILYSLVRCCCTLILVSNKKNALDNMDKRIQSRLSFERIEFEPYKDAEILKILKDKAGNGLNHNTINDDLLGIISARCNGDARTAIQIVRDSAIRSEINGEQSITSESIHYTIQNNTRDRIAEFVQKLNVHQKNIYDILKSNKSLPSVQIYTKCKDMTSHRLPARSYRYHIDKMERAGIIKSEGIKRWKSYSVIV